MTGINPKFIGEDMNTPAPKEAALLDKPDILSRLFHPRPDMSPSGTGLPIMIPVTENIAIGACLHPADKNAPNILFFHGNGEIVADYDDVGPLYSKLGINFLPVDYRGYGRSGGTPGVESMLGDSHAIFDFTSSWLREHGHTGPIVVMGRSLGSASALELGVKRAADISGMILESAFAYAVPLLELLGVRIENPELAEEKVFGHIRKMASFQNPVLIIHAEYDHIIPVSDGRTLFEVCRSESKTFLEIEGADHNDIFFRGLSRYMNAVGAFCKDLPASFQAPGG
jgi:alpha-beta hydrolase superfamily lysophospholipase